MKHCDLSVKQFPMNPSRLLSSLPWTCLSFFYPHHLLPRRPTGQLMERTRVGECWSVLLYEGLCALGPIQPRLSAPKYFPGWGPASPARSSPYSVRNWSQLYCWIPWDLPVILANSVTPFCKRASKHSEVVALFLLGTNLITVYNEITWDFLLASFLCKIFFQLILQKACWHYSQHKVLCEGIKG